MRQYWVATLLCLSPGVATTLLGCGGNAGPAPACMPFAACGGDLKGTWNVARSCPTAAGLQAAEDTLKLCPAGTASVDELDVSGTTTLDGQGAVKSDMVLGLTVSQIIPASCLNAGVTCPSVALALKSQSGVTSATCTAANGGCNCSMTASIRQRKEASYVVSGTNITTTDPSDGTMETDAYCVEGNVLRIQSPDEIDVWTR
jgi:hypothetical protein